MNIDTTVIPHVKTLQDIYVGVDVWGRGSHGGGGFGSYKAITHIDPEFLGLSVALFGQAWTWESEQDKPGWSWEAWWAYERLLWIGPQQAADAVPLPPMKAGEAECPHGTYEPISSFFPRKSPPNPDSMPILACFSPGVGSSWFVSGNKVAEFPNGWTDLDKTTSLGDLAWPRPSVQWQGEAHADELPDIVTSLGMDDAWLGGSSLRLSMSFKASDAEDTFFRCVWLPLQSVAITSGKTYDLNLVYKACSQPGVEFDFGLTVKNLGDITFQELKVEPAVVKPIEELANGWTRLSVKCVVPSNGKTELLAAAGLVVGVAVEDPTIAIEVSVHIGSLSITPTLSSPQLSMLEPKILWADFTQDAQSTSTTPNTSHETKPFMGRVSWDVTVSFTTAAPTRLTSPEDTDPIWPFESNFPVFAYFNIYMQLHYRDGTLQPLAEAVFIGTSGQDGAGDQFYVGDISALLPSDGIDQVRYVVQGVTCQGEVVPWERCAFTTVAI